MSKRVESWVWENSLTNGNERLVLVYLADQSDDFGGSCYPGIDLISQRVRIHRATVMRVIDRLETNGEILVERAGPGRGHYNRYVVLMGRDPDEAIDQILNGRDSRPFIPSTKTSQPSAEKVATAAEKVAPDATRLKDTLEIDPEKDSSRGSESLARSDVSLDARSTAIDLCEHLADAIAKHRDAAGDLSQRPIVTERWQRDMRLLFQRGPLHVEKPEPIEPGRIIGAIDHLFSQLADPTGRDGFCWADQIRSPGALRDHWLQLREASRRARATSLGSNAAAIERHRSRTLREQDDDAVTAPSQRPLSEVLNAVKAIPAQASLIGDEG